MRRQLPSWWASLRLRRRSRCAMTVSRRKQPSPGSCVRNRLVRARLAGQVIPQSPRGCGSISRAALTVGKQFVDAAIGDYQDGFAEHGFGYLLLSLLHRSAGVVGSLAPPPSRRLRLSRLFQPAQRMGRWRPRPLLWGRDGVGGRDDSRAWPVPLLQPFGSAGATPLLRPPPQELAPVARAGAARVGEESALVANWPDLIRWPA